MKSTSMSDSEIRVGLIEITNVSNQSRCITVVIVYCRLTKGQNHQTAGCTGIKSPSSSRTVITGMMASGRDLVQRLWEFCHF